jgi:hypothetical protein
MPPADNDAAPTALAAASGPQQSGRLDEAEAADAKLLASAVRGRIRDFGDTAASIERVQAGLAAWRDARGAGG